MDKKIKNKSTAVKRSCTIVDESASPVDWSGLDSDDRKGAGRSAGIRIEKVRSDRLPGVGDSFTVRSDEEVKQPYSLQLPSYKALLLTLTPYLHCKRATRRYKTNETTIILSRL